MQSQSAVWAIRDGWQNRETACLPLQTVGWIGRLAGSASEMAFAASAGCTPWRWPTFVPVDREEQVGQSLLMPVWPANG